MLKKYNLKVGDILTVSTAGIQKKFRISGPISDPSGIDENLIVMDISSAQEIFGRVGFLDRIDVISDLSDVDLSALIPTNL